MGSHVYMGCLSHARGHRSYMGGIMKSLFKKAERKTVIKIDYSEFDRVVTEHYGIVMESVAVEEWNNYMDKEIEVTSGGWKYSGDQEDFEDMLDDSQWYMGAVRLCLQDLANKGLIEKGVYMIEVFW